jgi:5-methylthioadenosine/S-adenosylhomocysteine deaminase
MYDFPDATARAFAEVGMRANVCRVGLSFVPGRLADCIEFTRRANGPEAKGSVVADICIHSEYLTDEGFCRELAAANRELARPLHVHVSETRKEHDECVARHGKTPIAYLADTGLLDCGGYAAHCVWCTDDDFRVMAEKGISLVHNPTSNMKLGSGFARIVRAMELGVNVALGTDGTASNDNLDMFEEMHIASLVHKGLAQDPTVLSPWDIIEMATKNGARALGRDDIGEIAVGKKADFCVVDMDRPHLLPALDLAGIVVYSMHSGDVARTIVGGKTAYDRSRVGAEFCGVDRESAKANLLASVSRLCANGGR